MEDVERIVPEAGAEIEAKEGEGESVEYIAFPSADFEKILEAAAAKAVRALRKEEAKEKKKSVYHDTFYLMRRYRDAVFHIENAISEGAQLEDLEDMTEEQRETYLRSVRRTRFKTMLMTANIDKVINEVAKRRAAAGRQIEYQVFDMYFMQGMTYDQIIDQIEAETGERLGKNTPRRWVTGIINEMSTLLWGLED